MIVLLENGNEKAGLKHILDGNRIKPGHADEFEKAFVIRGVRLHITLKRLLQTGKLSATK